MVIIIITLILVIIIIRYEIMENQSNLPLVINLKWDQMVQNYVSSSSLGLARFWQVGAFSLKNGVY